METSDLLKRIEEQAVEIADLKNQVFRLQQVVDGETTRHQQRIRGLLTGMANGNCNCNGHSGCRLACRMVDQYAE